LLEGSGFVLRPVHGTYFQLADYSAVSDLPDVRFCEALTRRHGVAAIPLSPFCDQAPEVRLVRFCFAKHDATLDAAAVKLRAVRRVTD
jgi:methionine aminotransferase